MGDPKKHRKNYSAPGHPWQRERIDEEKKLMAEYGFKNKTEIWRMVSFLRSASAQAKKLVTLPGAQAEKEKELLLNRLRRYGLLSPEAGLDAILSISLRDVLERRLQTIVYKKNLANSVKQARQFITHEHISVGDRIITSPSYLVPLKEEVLISFKQTSSLDDPEHPERVASRLAKEKQEKEMVVGEDKPRSKGGKAGLKKGHARKDTSRKGPGKKEGRPKKDEGR